MHVISQKRIWQAKEKYPQSSTALDAWYRLIKLNKFHSFSAIKAVFNSLDKVSDLYVFNIGGNKLRLIASIHFNRGRLYVRQILTHEEYDKGDWKRSR